MPTLAGTRFLLTGASGFLGGAVASALVDGGATVHALVRPGADFTPLAAVRSRITWHEGDLTLRRSVARVVRTAAPDVVVHLAAGGVRRPFLPLREALRQNLTATLNLLEALDPATRVIVGRTPGEATAMNPYSASKAAAWQIVQLFVRTQGRCITGVMPFHVYGPGQPPGQLIPSAVRAALVGDEFPMTHGTQLRDWIHVEDVAHGVVATITGAPFAGETLHLGTGLGTSIVAVVEQVYALVGCGGRPMPGAVAARPGEVPVMVADAEATARTLGWRSRVSLADGLRDTVAVLRRHAT